MERADYKPLNTRPIDLAAGFHRPAGAPSVRMDSPALDAMTDLARVQVATTTPETSLTQATQAMIDRGVRLLLVVNADGRLAGLITARDTMGERPIKHIHANGGSYADLRVRDCMTPARAIEVLTMEQISRAEVGHMVATLKSLGRQHALVVDKDPLSGGEMIRGIFSTTQIGRQLGVNVQAFEVAKTFAEIEMALSA